MNSDDNPYQAPTAPLVGSANEIFQRHKKQVVFDPLADWPQRCIKCNAPTHNKKAVTLYYYNPWIVLLVLVNILILIVVYLIARKSFKLQLPVCDTHLKKHRRVFIIQYSLLAVLLVSLIAAATLAADWPLYLSGIVLIPIFITGVMTRLAHLPRYKDGRLYLSGAGKPFLDSLNTLY